MMDLQSILTLAREVNFKLTALADSKISEQDIVESISAYVDAFASWDQEDGLKAKEIDREMLQELATLHTKITEGAMQLKGDTGQRIKSLNIRRKGLLAYVDPLPKKISFRKPKKG